jgi:hypothetical protein
MAYKSKVVSGTPSTYTKVGNSAGFSSRSNGSDTVPGPQGGAPLMNTRTVDDGPVKSSVYANGVSPGSMMFTNQGKGTLGDLGTQAPTRDSPATGGPRPHPDLMTKVEEAASGEATIGDVPRGTLGR